MIKTNNIKLQNSINENSELITRALNFFGVSEIDTYIHVLNYDEFKKEYHDYFHKEANEYSVGFIKDSKNEVIVLDYDDYKYTKHNGESYERFVKVAIHEVIHVIHSIACKHNYPETKLWEGIAVYLSDQYINSTGTYHEYGVYIEEYLKNHSKEELLKILNVDNK